MKPIVNCDVFGGLESLQVGGVAIIFPYNHPNHCEGHFVTNGEIARTSKIVSINLKQNQFETLNTIYILAEK